MSLESRTVPLLLNEAQWRYVEARAQRNGVDVGDVLSVIASLGIEQQMRSDALFAEYAGPMANGRLDGYPTEEGSERFGQLPAEPAAV